MSSNCYDYLCGCFMIQKDESEKKQKRKRKKYKYSSTLSPGPDLASTSDQRSLLSHAEYRCDSPSKVTHGKNFYFDNHFLDGKSKNESE